MKLEHKIRCVVCGQHGESSEPDTGATVCPDCPRRMALGLLAPAVQAFSPGDRVRCRNMDGTGTVVSRADAVAAWKDDIGVDDVDRGRVWAMWLTGSRPLNSDPADLTLVERAPAPTPETQGKGDEMAFIPRPPLDTTFADTMRDVDRKIMHGLLSEIMAIGRPKPAPRYDNERPPRLTDEEGEGPALYDCHCGSWRVLSTISGVHVEVCAARCDLAERDALRVDDCWDDLDCLCADAPRWSA